MTVRQMTGLMGWDELVTWIAMEELEPFEAAANRRAALLAYYSANGFANPVQMPELLAQFGVPEDEPLPAGTALVDLLSANFTAVPDHIRARFEAP